MRDKVQREVDFLVVRIRRPWMLVEAKHRDRTLSPALACFQERLKVPHGMQVVIDLPFEQADCFAAGRPMVVPARTFLARLP